MESQFDTMARILAVVGLCCFIALFAGTGFYAFIDPQQNPTANRFAYEAAPYIGVFGSGITLGAVAMLGNKRPHR